MGLRGRRLTEGSSQPPTGEVDEYVLETGLSEVNVGHRCPTRGEDCDCGTEHDRWLDVEIEPQPCLAGRVDEPCGGGPAGPGLPIRRGRSSAAHRRRWSC